MPAPEWVKPAWVALVEILNRIEEQPYHWPVGRIIFQKIAYLASQQGLPTGLEYKKGSFGPFSPDVKKIVTSLVNNGLIREERLGRMFGIKVGPTYRDARKAYATDLEQWEFAIEEISDLFMRIRNTDQAEHVATVLFAADMLRRQTDDEPTEMQVLEAVMEWKRRRKPALDRDEVALTIRNLAALGWLKVKCSSDMPVADELALSFA